MPKKELSNSEKRRVQIQKDFGENKQSYCFPEEGITVQASSLEEAHLEKAKLLKPKEKNNA